MGNDIRHWLRQVRPATKADDNWASSSEAADLLADIHRRTATSTRRSGRRFGSRGIERRRLPAGVVAGLAATAVVASIGWAQEWGRGGVSNPNVPINIGIRPASMLLQNYSSCEDLLAGLRERTAAAVGPLGFPSEPYFDYSHAAGPMMGSEALAAEDSSGSASNKQTETSTTNVHEPGVDEPDLVKTTTTRVVTVEAGVLRLIDRTTRKITGSLDLRMYSGWQQAQLLVDDHHALVILGSQGNGAIPPVGRAMPSRSSLPAPSSPSAMATTYLYVDLDGQPKITGSLRAPGSFLDARLIGSTIRLVVASAPTIALPAYQGGAEKSKAANQGAIRHAPLEAWVPRYTVTVGGQSTESAVPCGQISHPADYTGTSMLTIYSLDLSHLASTTSPVSVVADGDTVYATKNNLYIASNPKWYDPQATQSTELHRFDISGSGPPAYQGSGRVPGRILSQYSLSDYAGTLRIATTIGAANPNQSSSVYVLNADDLSVIGHLDGLGKSEQIYAVRFVGALAYVVTFRQTDPLYVIDLRSPAAPKLAGELELTGYSGYLHDAGDGRLIGVGQEASSTGRVQGMQVSLFDVAKPAAPQRLGHVVLDDAPGEGPIDPHAFLYWQPTGLIAVPVQSWSADSAGKLLMLKVAGSTLTKLGLLANPGAKGPYDSSAAILRSMIVDGDLWTLSSNGMQVSDASSLARQAWVSFS